MTDFSLIKGEVNYIFIFTKQPGYFLPKQIFRNQFHKGSRTVLSLCCLILCSDFRAAESKAGLKQHEMSHDTWRSEDGWHFAMPQSPFWGDLPWRCSSAWGQLFLWIPYLYEVWLIAGNCTGLLGVDSDNPGRCLVPFERPQGVQHVHMVTANLLQDPLGTHTTGRAMPNSNWRPTGKPQGISNGTRCPCAVELRSWWH